MASNKRKQDEKHLKMLREMVALPHNKQCFDCHQRGPTYVNMTIASFVCTSCSGLLRGLNPPHRVKSISMTSFTTEEMEFLRSRGNDFCRKVWLGLYDSRLHNEPESKDENKRKDFMSQKYEKKRWYVEPTQHMYEEAKIQNTPPKQPDPKQLRSIGNSFPSLKVTQKPQQQVPKPVTAPPQPSQTVQSPVQNLPTSRQGAGQIRLPTAQPQNTQPQNTQPPQRSAGFDLLEDFGDSDPFAVTNQPAAPCPSTGEGFADFANFSSLTSPPASQPPAFPGQQLTSPASATGVLQPVGTTAQPAPPGLNLLSSTTTTTTSSAAVMSMGDRYAALADLDTVFGGGTTGGQTVNWDGSYGSAFGGSANSAAGSGANVGWDGSAAVSSGGGWSGNSPATSGTVQTSGSNTIIGGFPGPGNTTTATAANPFGGNPPASSPVVGNPFAGTATNLGQPITSMNQFGQTPTSAPAASFGQFGSTTNSIAPGVASGGGQFTAVQNGGFGLPQAQPGWPVGTQGQVNAFSGAPSANMNYNSAPNMGQGQYMKMGQPAFTSGQQQQFGGWGGQPVGNPFMNVNAQQAVPPRGSSTNPFL